MTRSLRLLEPWRSRLLWVSLAINVFAIPLMIAPHVMHRRAMGPPSFDTIIERLARELPASDATTFRTTMSRERPWFEQGRRALDEARQEVAARAAQPQWDPAAVRAGLRAMEDRLRESGARFDDSLVLALGEISPEGRANLAATIRKRRP